MSERSSRKASARRIPKGRAPMTDSFITAGRKVETAGRTEAAVVRRSESHLNTPHPERQPANTAPRSSGAPR